jgi:GNAT superfamily N-acetyltransferase
VSGLPLRVRSVAAADYAAWLPLWDGYNAFYGRSGETALPLAVTQVTWHRFFDPAEPVFAVVAEADDRMLGLCHYLFHRSTSRIEPVCYLQDLFTVPQARGRGVGRALIEAVYERATSHDARRVYWQTQDSNATARLLYDRIARHHGFLVYTHDL